MAQVSRLETRLCKDHSTWHFERKFLISVTCCQSLPRERGMAHGSEFRKRKSSSSSLPHWIPNLDDHDLIQACGAPFSTTFLILLSAGLHRVLESRQLWKGNVQLLLFCQVCNKFLLLMSLLLYFFFASGSTFTGPLRSTVWPINRGTDRHSNFCCLQSNGICLKRKTTTQRKVNTSNYPWRLKEELQKKQQQQQLEV